MGRVGGRLLSIGDLIVYRPPPFIGFKSSLWATIKWTVPSLRYQRHRTLQSSGLWVVRWMYRVDVYLRVRRAVMVEGKSIREVSREFGLHWDTVRKMLAHSVPPG